ncbi:hypothetical protein HIM_08273 [Hirsutella minnesotensis 3608]|uniref:Dimethylallyl tryptophan synthase GliD1 n=1 Tax=Hirsutella minnesotensis 3608 TaxID=1043627 RepID=A0A0F7ZYE8_9HYPO|nr:hypothetical protein HIM_08273 [Hirsutella minnesotensis 3608]
MSEVSALDDSQHSPVQAWKAISQWLPSRGKESDYWWDLTGRHLATMMDAAGYTIEKQYEALVFHYHWIVPYLGPAPTPDGSLAWPSLLGVKGLPIEYSWKWNTASGKPDVRYTLESIGKFTGTSRDRLNQDASREMLQQLADAMPSVDLTWANHFFATLYDHDRSKYEQEATKGAHFTTTVMNAVEFVPKGLTMKTYFIPRKLGQDKGQIPPSLWEETLAQLDPTNVARAALYDFTKSSPEGKLLSPFMLAVDDVAPAKSRLKLYFRTPHTSFSSVREIMTLGGRIPVPEAQLQDLRSLIAAVTGLPEGFPEDAQVARTPESQSDAKSTFVEGLPDLLSGYIYYFDLAPGSVLPDIKFYSQVRHYGLDDLSLAKGITGWMDAHGRGQYCQRYLTMLKSLCPHRQLDEGKGMQVYLSCLFKKTGELDITSYVVPEVCPTEQPPSPELASPKRGTRRRSKS